MFLTPLFLLVEYSGDPGCSPAVLPGGLLHILQDPRSQSGRRGPGSGLSQSADHIHVYEVTSMFWQRLHNLKLCQEISVGCWHQSVPFTWKQDQTRRMLLLFTPFPVCFDQCAMLWWWSLHRLLHIPGMLMVIMCSRSPGTLPRDSHRSAPHPPQTQHLTELSSLLERLLK